MEQHKYEDIDYCKRPLSRSITVRCIVFIIVLCVALGVVIHISYRQALYQRYQAYITDILEYVHRHIDNDDLSECADTLERSEKFDALEAFMDGIKEDFDIHYLYILKPFHEDGEDNVMSVISAEDYQHRYIDTEESLYLGFVADGEYDRRCLLSSLGWERYLRCCSFTGQGEV